MKQFKFLKMVLPCLALSLSSCGGASSTEESVAERVFMKNGYCTYSVLLGENYQELEYYAANEFVNRIKEASGILLNIVNEPSSFEGNYISLGRTSAWTNTFKDVDLSSLEDTQSAYYRTYKDGNIYIISSDDFQGAGTLYGVYDLLEELCDYEYFASDEVYVAQTNDMSFKEVTNRFLFPSFDSCSVSTYQLLVNKEYTRRMRNIMPGGTSEWNHATWGHGQISYYVPYSQYGLSHPDWYASGNSNPNSNQLCLMAGEELEDVVVAKFAEFLSADLSAQYFCFMQQDVNTGCTCSKCQEAIDTWAMNYQGIQVRFMNRIIPRVEEWIAENQPGRSIYYVVYGYQHTYEPPVVSDEKGGYKYYSEDVIPNEKIRFMVAPIDGNYTYTFNDPINSDLLAELKKWKTYASNHYIIYFYDCNFKFYFINFNNFGSFRTNLEVARDNGAYYYLTNGASDSGSGCFNELRTYVESRLTWDLTRSPEELTELFFEHYYKDAKEPLMDIFNRVRDQYAVFDTLIRRPTARNIYADLLSEDLWPYESVRQMELQIKKAFENIEHYRSENASLYQTLSNRIYKEYLTVIYLKVKLYKSYCSDGELENLQTIWETYTKMFGMTKEAESYNSVDIF